jgi:acetoin utilization deacetylase AcuC-like enzyme
MTVGLIYDPVYLKHDTGDHVENRSRLVATMGLLEESGLLDRLTRLSPRAATAEEIALVHSRDHVARVQGYSARGGGWLDGDTVASPDSFTVALYAVGGVLRGVDAIVAGEVDQAFALVRPPGHHATPDYAMGFCLFNNVAIAAKYAMASHGLERVLIADFDVHHGNGTEETFYGDPNVLYFSTHQYPHYPGTGAVAEDGVAEGKGTTVNVPLPAFCGDEEYRRAYTEILVPVARRFRPQLILVSAGYDAHRDDPLAAMQVTVDGFAAITGILKELAAEFCGGRLLLSLEGGYHLQALAHSIRATLEVLLGSPVSPDPLGTPHGGAQGRDIDSILGQVAARHGLR